MTTPLHIGFDAKRAFQNQTGLGNYSRNLLWALAQYYPQHHYHLYAPDVIRRGIEPFLQSAPFNTHTPQGFIHRLLPSLWRSFMLGSQLAGDGMQLYHGLSNELPLDIQESKVRSVVTIHDLIFLDHPELYPTLDRQIYRAKSARACEQANHIIAISEQTKQAIIRHFGTRESKISVVYQSCHPAFLIPPKPEVSATVKNRYQLPEQYLLYVGAIAQRKQTLQLVQAFHQLNDKGLKLVLVGNGGSYKQEIEKYIKRHFLEDRVLFLQKVPTLDLVAIYHMAMAMVYPSLMEGFGIPIIEAMCCGTPVITTTGGCFEEAGGDAACYVPAGKVNTLTDALEAVTQSAELREDMRAQGFLQAQRFAPATFAQEVMEVYHKVIA